MRRTCERAATFVDRIAIEPGISALERHTPAGERGRRRGSRRNRDERVTKGLNKKVL